MEGCCDARQSCLNAVRGARLVPVAAMLDLGGPHRVGTSSTPGGSNPTHDAVLGFEHCMVAKARRIHGAGEDGLPADAAAAGRWRRCATRTASTAWKRRSRCWAAGRCAWRPKQRRWNGVDDPISHAWWATLCCSQACRAPERRTWPGPLWRPGVQDDQQSSLCADVKFLLLGDFRQLPAVLDSWAGRPISAPLEHGQLIRDLAGAHRHELTENMRSDPGIFNFAKWLRVGEEA